MALEVENLRDVVDFVNRRKWSLILPAVSLLALAAVLVVVLPSKYRSTSTILIEEQEIPREFVTATVTSFAEQRLQSINQRIMSTPKLIEIMNRFNLYADLKASKTTEEIVARMRKDVKFETISADVIDPRSGRPTPATIAFSLSYVGNNPATAQKVANVLASLYLEENLKVREQQTQGTSDFMNEEMKRVKANLDEIESKIAAYKERNINSLPELTQLNYSELDRVDRDIDTLNAQIRSLKEREAYLQSQLATIPTDEASDDKRRLSELKVQLGNLRSRVSDSYPDVKKVKYEIAELEKRLKDKGRETLGKPDNPAYINLASQLAGTQNEIESARRQISTLEKKRAGYSRRIEASPRVDEGYRTLVVERNNLQLKYDDLSKKAQEAKVSHGLEKEQKGERFTIIDAARLPEKPFSPNIPAFLLIGLVLGIGAGVGTAMVLESTDHSVQSAEALAKATGCLVLAAIPRIITAEDVAQSRRKRTLLFSGTACCLVVAVAAFHFLIMDLDVFWARLLRKL